MVITFKGLSIKPTFIPRTGLQLWLKADAITGLSDGDPVSTWTDQSGNGNDATQQTAANKPLYKTNIVNGKPVVRFDGTSDLLATANTMVSRTIFAVAELDGAVAAGFNYLVSNGNDFLDIRWQSSGGLNLYRGNNNTNINDFTNANGLFFINGVATDAITLGEFHIVSATLGSLATNGGTAQKIEISTYFMSRYWDGDIAEIIIYNVALSTSERQSVEHYLANKYGIALS